MDKKKHAGFWILIIIGIILTILLLMGQTFALIDYDLTVSMGLQESVNEVTELGTVWARAFGFGDTIIYIPLLIAGITGLLKRKKWGLYCMFGAMAITAYWPPVNLFPIYAAKNILTLDPDKYISFSILLPLITIYGLWGMWYLYNKRTLLVK